MFVHVDPVKPATVHLGVKRSGCPSVLPWFGVFRCSGEGRLPIAMVYVSDGTPSAYVSF
jgi:hypothetical protein